MVNYDRSFDFEGDEIPCQCPICKNEFDLSEDIDISPYRDGIRVLLVCPNCHFKKVLSYTTWTEMEGMRREMEEEYEEEEYEEDEEDYEEEEY